MAGNTEKSVNLKDRPYVGITFKCCRVYRRIFLTVDKSAFAGSCPKCGAPIRIRTGPGGSKSRFWNAG
jgi:hypothetical protein